MKQITVPFGGFYGSLHEAVIDDALELDEVDYEVDFQVIFKKYAKNYMQILQEFLYDEFSLDIKFHSIFLSSPKAYNYTTDVILCGISEKSRKALIKEVMSPEFKEWLKEHTVSYDGYVSFYTYTEALDDSDGVLINYVMEYICQELLVDEEYLNYYYGGNYNELISLN